MLRVLERANRLARMRMLRARTRGRMQLVSLARSWRMLRATSPWVVGTVLRVLEPVLLRMVLGTSTRQ
ncbi:hypothetical protein EV651_10170 [Kribbella sp. VKM Ac-2571]|nr:hypothetical protein EV651_10170 [Kribbella sp. VKM Ac-2571]